MLNGPSYYIAHGRTIGRNQSSLYLPDANITKRLIKENGSTFDFYIQPFDTSKGQLRSTEAVVDSKGEVTVLTNFSFFSNDRKAQRTAYY